MQAESRGWRRRARHDETARPFGQTFGWTLARHPDGPVSDVTDSLAGVLALLDQQRRG